MLTHVIRVFLNFRCIILNGFLMEMISHFIIFNKNNKKLFVQHFRQCSRWPSSGVLVIILEKERGKFTSFVFLDLFFLFFVFWPWLHVWKGFGWQGEVTLIKFDRGLSPFYCWNFMERLYNFLFFFIIRGAHILLISMLCLLCNFSFLGYVLLL